jgi:hypothetical protein
MDENLRKRTGGENFSDLPKKIHLERQIFVHEQTFLQRLKYYAFFILVIFGLIFLYDSLYTKSLNPLFFR